MPIHWGLGTSLANACSKRWTSTRSQLTKTFKAGSARDAEKNRHALLDRSAVTSGLLEGGKGWVGTHSIFGGLRGTGSARPDAEEPDDVGSSDEAIARIKCGKRTRFERGARSVKAPILRKAETCVGQGLMAAADNSQAAPGREAAALRCVFVRRQRGLRYAASTNPSA